MKERLIQALVAAAVTAMLAFAASIYDTLKGDIIDAAAQRAVTELEFQK